MQLFTIRSHRTSAQECYLNTIIFHRAFSCRGKPSLLPHWGAARKNSIWVYKQYEAQGVQDIHLYTPVAFACYDIIMQ